MKTPQEIKAKELVERYLNIIIHFPYTDTEDGYCIGTGYMTHNSAVRCAKIAVEEIKEEMRDYCDYNHHQDRMNYWQEVLNCLNRM